MDCSTPGFPVHHQIPELTQTHVHQTGDAIQPSYPLSPPSPPALNLSQHQGVFHWVSSLHQLVGHYIQLIYNFKTKANSLDLNKNTSLVSVGADSWESLGLQGGPTNQSILKEIRPEYSLEGLMLKLKLQHFGHLMWRTDSLEKTLMLGKIEGKRRRGNRGWYS